jgi:hypothetical protein
MQIGAARIKARFANRQVPPIEKALHKGFIVVQTGDAWHGCGKD